MTPVFNTTTDLLNHAAKEYPHHIALLSIVAGKQVSLTFGELKSKAHKLALQLLKAGIQKNENIGLISPNRNEWYIADAAIAMVGAVNVALFPNYDSKDFAYILNHANIKHLFVGNKLIYQFIDSIQDELPQLQQVYSFDETYGKPVHHSILTHEEELELNELLINRRTKGSDSYTIFYTSGTGGTPKGVVMSHQSVVNTSQLMADYLNLQTNDKSLSFLSASHAYERGHYFAYLSRGTTIQLAESTISPLANIQKYQPNVFIAVPLILQKIMDSVLSITELEPLHANAVQQMLKYEFGDEYGNDNFKQYATIYTIWKNALTDKLRAISCSGAPLPDKVFRFFSAIGIPLQEIYGLSECFVVSCGRFPDKVKFGCSGAIGKDVEVKIADDNEILVRNTSMMSCFYNLPDLTREVLSNDGWFKTGDKGEIVDGQFLKITGRKKDVFKLSNGLYISPVEIETILHKSPLISQALIFERNGQIEAIIVPNETAIDPTLLNSNSTISIVELIVSEIDRLYNCNVLPNERITNIIIDEDVWSIENGKLTPTLKVKREFILKLKNVL